MLMDHLKRRGQGVAVIHAKTNRRGTWTGETKLGGYGWAEVQWPDARSFVSVALLAFADVPEGDISNRDRERARAESDAARANAGATAARFPGSAFSSRGRYVKAAILDGLIVVQVSSADTGGGNRMWVELPRETAAALAEEIERLASGAAEKDYGRTFAGAGEPKPERE